MSSPILKTVKVEAAHQGLNTTDSPSAIGATQAPVLTNLLVGERGRTQHRGPMQNKDLPDAVNAWGVTPSSVRPISIAGHWTSARIGFKQASTTEWIEPWDARFSGTSTGLAQADTSSITLGITTGGAPAVPAREAQHGWRTCQYGFYTYSAAYDSANDTNGNADGVEANDVGYYERRRRITNYNQSFVYSPRGAVDVAIHYGRFLTLGGSDPDPASTRTILTNVIWYTRALTATDFSTGINAADANATIWTDEVTGARNKIALLEWAGDLAVAWAPLNRDLVILGRNHIQLLTGYGPDTWSLKIAATNVGCVDPRSVVETDVGVFFMSRDGFMHFDGVNVTNVSRQINRTLVPAVMQRRGSIPTLVDEAGGHVLASPITRDHILVTVGRQPWGASWNSNPPTDDFCLLFHIPSGSWTNISSSGWGSFPLAQGWLRDGALVWTLDDASILRGRVWHSAAFGSHHVDITSPAASEETYRGRDGEMAYNASSPTDTVTYVAMPTEWSSRVIELAGPPHKAKLHRVLIDFEYVLDGDASDDLGTGPTVTIYDGDGTSLDSYTLPTSADTTKPPYRRRHVRQIASECTDLQVKISSAGQNSVGIRDYAIHGVWVEFHTAQERE